METTDGKTVGEITNGRDLIEQYIEYVGDVDPFLLEVYDGKYDDKINYDILGAVRDFLDELVDNTVPNAAEEEKDDLQELYDELRDEPRYNTGHLSESIRIDTHGYDYNPTIWSVVFDEDFFMSNPTYHLTKKKIALNSEGKLALSRKGKPIVLSSGRTWEPRAAEYDYRENADILVEGGRVFNEEYVKEKMKAKLGRE